MNKLIMSIFVPASGDFDMATIINVEHVTIKGYAVVATEGSMTCTCAFDSLLNAINYAYEYASLMLHC